MELRGPVNSGLELEVFFWSFGGLFLGLLLQIVLQPDNIFNIRKTPHLISDGWVNMAWLYYVLIRSRMNFLASSMAFTA